MKLPYPIYCPKWGEMAALDWAIEPVTSDLDAVMSSDFKIAALPVMCNVRSDFAYKPEIENIDLSQFDLVILTDIEYRPLEWITPWIEKNGIRNYVLALGGLHRNEIIDETCMVYRPWWSYNLLKFNQVVDTSSDNKPYDFDMLLGARRPHRDYAMLAFTQSGMLDRSIVTYREMFTGGVIDFWTEKVQACFPSTKLQYPYVSANLDPAWEVQENLVKNISPYMPYEIYRRANYTVVCETLGTADTFFLSEKTTKPLLAKRLFIMFGAVGFLKNLRKLGFETFGQVVDEHYDNIENHVVRFDAAFQQVQWLSEQDPREIYNLIQPELEHNCNLVQNLKHKTLQQMHDLLRTKIPKLD
jgi:hypothetical protein